MQRLFYLIWCGTIVSIGAGCGDTSLNSAIQRGDSAAVEKMCKDGVDLNKPGTKGQTALHTAILAGDKNLFTLLLAHKANPNVCDVDGTSVVHLAAEQEDVFWIREALAHGGNPNQPNTGNRFYPDTPPIFYAIAKERTASALELINAGADSNYRTKKDHRPFSSACFGNCFEVAYKLLDAGADPKLTNVLDNFHWDEEGDGSIIKTVDGIQSDREKEWYVKLNNRLHEEGYLKQQSPPSQ